MTSRDRPVISAMDFEQACWAAQVYFPASERWLARRLLSEALEAAGILVQPRLGSTAEDAEDTP